MPMPCSPETSPPISWHSAMTRAAVSSASSSMWASLELTGMFTWQLPSPACMWLATTMRLASM